MRITCLAQSGFLSMFRKANETLGFDMQLYSLQLAEDRPDTLKALIRALEDRGMNVIPVFSYSMIDVLKRLGVPVFQPIVSLYRTAEEWEASSGLANDIGWSVAMPEFECVIEPGWRNGPETASSRAEPSTNKSRKVLLT